MKLSRFLILITAASAGSLIYKVREGFNTPANNSASSESSVPSSGIYSSLTGTGSLMENIKTNSDAREAATSSPVIQSAGGIGQTGGLGRGKNQSKLLAPTAAVSKEVPDDLTLILAASRGDIEAVEKRLAAQSKVDSRDSLRRTPLMYAAWNGYTDLCSRLIAAGANPEFRDRQGNNVFDYAAGRGQLETIVFLLKRTNSQDKSNYQEYADLVKAAYSHDASLLPQGKGKLASINRINPEGQAPLYIAAGNGSVELMKALVARGANVNLSNGDKQTALHWAAWNNQSEAVKLLLEYGAALDQSDLAGNTPLIFAAQNGSAQASMLLLKSGANRYSTNKSGKTAALMAEMSGHRDLAQQLK